MANPKNPAWYGGGLSSSLRPGANRGLVIYLDGNAGADTNSGLTPDVPVATFLQALSLCTDWLDDTIVVIDYWSSGGEAWPIDVNKNCVHIIGVHGQGSTKVQVNPPGDTACFSINAENVEISYLSCNAGATHGAIEWAASEWGAEIHHCWFGEMGASQDGIRIDGGFDAVYAYIHHCRFGFGLTRNGILIQLNMTRGRISDNLFRTDNAAPQIHVDNTMAQGFILNNVFAVNANTAGGAITLDVTCVSNTTIDGNRAFFGDTAMGNNPYLDSAAGGSNNWGLNYRDITATLPA